MTPERIAELREQASDARSHEALDEIERLQAEVERLARNTKDERDAGGRRLAELNQKLLKVKLEKAQKMAEYNDEMKKTRDAIAKLSEDIVCRQPDLFNQPTA